MDEGEMEFGKFEVPAELERDPSTVHIVRGIEVTGARGHAGDGSAWNLYFARILVEAADDPDHHHEVEMAFTDHGCDLFMRRVAELRAAPQVGYHPN